MPDYSSLRKPELTKLLKALDVHYHSKDKKSTLLEKLEDLIEEKGSEIEDQIESLLQTVDLSDGEDEVTLAEAGTDKEVEEIDDDEEADDEEFKGPPIDVVKFFDPVIKFGEEQYQKLLELTDKIGITTLEYNDELRENLSTTITLNYIELLLEFSYFIYTYLPLIAVKDNSTIHPLIKQYFPALQSCGYKVPDLTYLLSIKILSIGFQWAVYAVLVPLAVSYYVNFSRRTIPVDDETLVTLRVYKFDPFIFGLFKVLIFYFLTFNAGTLVTLNSYSGIFKALQTHFLIHLGFYSEFVLSLGNFPFVLGIANVVIGLYAQFEDF